MSINEDYLRCLLRAVEVATDRWGKRPSRRVILNAAAAALAVESRADLSVALEQLEAAGFLARRNGGYLITTAGEGMAQSLNPTQERRLANHMAVSLRESTEALPFAQQELLYVLAVAERHQRMLGANSVGEVLSISTAEATERLKELTQGGYLAEHEVVPEWGIQTYSLTKAGRFELRRGPLRIETIRFPGARSERAQELVELTMEVLDE